MSIQKERFRWFGRSYLDWGLWEDKPPTHKHLSDNLRALLTIGAYFIVLRYLWETDPVRIPRYVFQLTVVVWGLWVGWFAVLTITQTVHLYIGFIRILIFHFGEPFISFTTDGEVTPKTRTLLTVVFTFLWCIGMVLWTGILYLGDAFLNGHLSK
jgi:hypothetical protein